MTEREEFELVAKAAGYEYASNKGDVHWIKTEFGLVHWMPKTDDGDCLRLAVNLGIDLVFDEELVKASQWELKIAEDKIFSDHPDKYVAVRAAVWDVAVEVAKRRMEK
jgi:hypothetical protein